MRKRITSLLLTLAMLLSLLPAMGVTASAADGFKEVNTYGELKAAVDKGEAKVKLVANIDTTNENAGAGVTDQTALKFFGNDNILDLNGHTLKLVSNTGTTFINVNKDLTIQDSGTGGRIDFVYGPSVMHRTTAIYVSHASNEDIAHLTVKSGTLSSTKGGITLIESIGNLTINGGKFYAPYEVGTGGTYAIHTIHQYNDNAKTIITGGEIDGVVFIQRTDSAATGTPNYGDIPVQIKGGTFKQHMQLRWTEKGEPSGYPTEFSPAVEIAGGIFEKRINPIENGVWGRALSTKLTGGTFKDYTSLGLGKGDSTGTDYKYYLKSLGNSIIMRGNEIRTSCDWSKADWFNVDVGSIYGGISLDGSESNPVTVIPNAWGMKSVTLDGTEINYAKDWKGAVEEMDNSTAHTLKFTWKDLAQELKDAGYSYRAECDRYISGNKTPTTDPISATANEYSFTIPAGAEPKVYSFDLKLNLKKDDSPYNIGIISNEHIVKLVVNQAPVVVPDPTIDGTVYYTSGIVFGRSISIAPSVTPAEATKSYQWQRSTDGGSTWKNIEGETRGSYTPVEADMGENVRIRVKITAEGYLGEIIGAAVKVSKADNNGYPEVIKLEAVKNGEDYTGFKITNFDSDCEYVYSTTDTPKWDENKITSETVTGLTSDKTYYVFARFKETATHTAGSIVSKNSIGLFDNVPLHYVLLEGYNSGETIYIKKDESVELKVSADPINANYWNKITFKERGTATGCITVDNAEIAASGENAASFSDHTIKITGVSEGRATLIASYPSATESFYGTWDVVVYNDPADALRLENVYTYADITLSENDEAELPTDLPKLLPENSGYHLEWRIVKSTTHLTQDDNITLENGKIKPRTAHTGSEKTQVELVAVKDGSTTTKLLAKTSPFYVTVTDAPEITLTGVTVAPKKVNLDLNANKTCQLSAVKEPVNAEGDLHWTSDKPAVATVDNTGKVTAQAQGTATIKVTCGGMEATCTVTVDHTHDYTGQPWVYMDPGTHTKTCTAGDNTKYEPHNWQWVVDTHATSTTAGKKHEECSDCHAKRNEGTVIPATGGGSSSGGGSSGGGGGAGVTTYAITVQNSKNGTVTASHKSAAKDTAVTLTVTPDKGYALDTLTVLDSKNKAVKLTEKNGKYTFTMPAGKVTVSAAFKAAAPASENPFTDVPSGAYYEDAVIWAVKKDITSGTSATTFNPDGSCTRAQAVTFLWRAAGSPEPKSAAMPFTDVPAGSYFEKAVLWAVENGVTKGTSDTTFSPDASCTRAQIVTFLWRAGGSPAVSGNSAFSDVASDAYYAAAVAWAEKNGVTGGIGGGLFGSDNTCTRAQIVTFLHRAMK